jgi:hypothetical protein
MIKAMAWDKRTRQVITAIHISKGCGVYYMPED